ncbi:hypothetical protein EV1_023726 [Malus domestica]
MASSTSSPANPDILAPNSSSMNPNPNFPISSISSITIQNISCMVPTKLKRDNYLVWKALFAPIFRRYKLTGILDGTEVCPPPFLLDSSGHSTGAPNPAFEAWYEKDQNILIWLNSTLSEEIIPFTVGVSSSRELWINLEQRFGGVSAVHIHQLRTRLHSVQKGDLSISAYIQQIKGISDALMAAGAPISDPDLIAVTLNGLSDEYESFIDSIMLRISSTSLDELHGLLINKELFMDRKKKSVVPSVTEPFHAYAAQSQRSQAPLLPTPPFNAFPQAFVAPYSNYNSSKNYRGSHRGHTRGNNRGNNRSFPNYRGTNNFRGNSYTPSRSSGGSNRQYSGGRVPCQICHSHNHEAIDCFERMNHAFAGKIPPAKLAAMCAHTTAKSTSPTWILDSGATSHITNDISAIHSPMPYHGDDKVYIGDGQGMPIHHTGTSVLKTPTAAFKLNNVLHVPHMKFNLLSAYQFLKDNYCQLILDSDGSTIKDRSTGRMLFQGPVSSGFYPVQGTSPASVCAPVSTSSYANISTPASLQLWHKRLGHPSSAIFRKILSRNKLAYTGKPSVSFFCQDCAIGKNHKLPFSVSTSSTTHSLELVHCDVWGPAPISSVSGYKFYVLFVDEYTKYSWLFPLKFKSEVFSIFVHFKSYVETLTGNKIKTLRSDSGGEFTSSQFRSFLLQHGILHQFSCPHTPEQNGCVERKHRHLTETTRTMLAASKVPHKFWVEAFSTAVYLVNRLPISGLDKSPWELLFHKPPDYSRLKVFGCSCYPWLKPYVSSKLDGKSTPCAFLGYSLQHKGYRCLDMHTSRVYISRHVLFNESHFPFQHKPLPSSTQSSFSVPDSTFLLPFPITSSSTAPPAPSHISSSSPLASSSVSPPTVPSHISSSLPLASPSISPQ